MRQTAALFVASLKMLVRDRTALVGTVAFPVVFVLVFSLFDLSLLGEGVLGAGTTGARGLDYFGFVLPGLLANGLLSFTMVGMAGSVARYRETRILRRMVATPLAPAAFIVAQVAARLVLALVQVLLILGLGMALGADVVPSRRAPSGSARRRTWRRPRSARPRPRRALRSARRRRRGRPWWWRSDPRARAPRTPPRAR